MWKFGRKNEKSRTEVPEPISVPRKRMTTREIDEYLAKMDEELLAEEIEIRRSIEEARRLPWWMFGFSTHVP
jgi:hypothetical protein